jgi:hypothetical protein
MGHHRSNRAAPLRGGAIAFIIACGLAMPVLAEPPDLQDFRAKEGFRAEIDAFVGRLGPSSNGVVRWAGSDPYEIRRDGDALVASIGNVRLSLGIRQIDRLILDRIEIRRVGQREDGKLIEFALQLPKQMTLKAADDAETKIALQDATASAVVEAQTGRGRESAIAIAGARLEQADTGAWVRMGPLSMSSKLVAEPSGGWSGPVEFEVKNTEYFVPQAPVGGAIDRIAFSGRSEGPSLASLDKLRETLDALQSENGLSPEERGAKFLQVLTSSTAPFRSVSGDLAVDGVTIRNLTGEPLVSLANAGTAVALTGLDSEAASIRFSIRHGGLDLAPAILEAAKVPHRVVLDFEIADISMQAIGQLLRAATAMADEKQGNEEERQSKKQGAAEQLLGAVAMLNPSFHIYDAAIETQDVGVDLTGEAKGSPLTPKGYTAAGDLVIRGFDELPKWGANLPFADYLPVLKELGVAGEAPDGTARTTFHLASAPPEWLTINGGDVSLWFDPSEREPGRSRVLKPSDPPMQGNDVKSVQHALSAAKISVAEDGVYSSATAAAVARFQKQNGINITGVVDAATRQRLETSSDAPRQGGRN